MPSKRTNDSVDRILEELNMQQAQAGLRDSVTDHQVDEILRSVGILSLPDEPLPEDKLSFPEGDALDDLLQKPVSQPAPAPAQPRPYTPVQQPDPQPVQPDVRTTRPPEQPLPTVDKTRTQTFSGDTTGTGIIKGFLGKMAPGGDAESLDQGKNEFKRFFSAQPRTGRGAPRRKAGAQAPAAAGTVRTRRHGLGRDPQNLSQEDVTMSGTLYLVGTPIGNLGDLSVRALETLRSADFIAAEDTRVTAKLLNHFEIKKPCVSYYEHNKYASGEKIVARLLAGETCALVTDAGMPAISDPGEDIVRQCAEQGIDVQVIPGPCAAIAALAVSGLPTQQFCFEGFLAVSGKTRREHLERLRGETRTMIFYEAPHKLLRTLCDLRDTFGGAREITLARELTKLHEQKLRTTLDGAVAYFTETPPKGEFVLVLRGAPERSEPVVTAEQALEIVARYRSEGRALKEACKLAAADTGFGKNELYQMALNA